MTTTAVKTVGNWVIIKNIPAGDDKPFYTIQSFSGRRGTGTFTKMAHAERRAKAYDRRTASNTGR